MSPQGKHSGKDNSGGSGWTFHRMKDGGVRFQILSVNQKGKPLQILDMQWDAQEWIEIVADMGADLGPDSSAIKLVTAKQIHLGK